MDLNGHIYNVNRIHSKQPWFVLSADKFSTHLTTQSPVVSHFYSFDTNTQGNPTIAIPDGCVDLLFDCDPHKPSAQVCGTTLKATSVTFERKKRYFGVRFLPGILPDFINATAEELVDKQIDIFDVITGAQSTFEQVVYSNDFTKQVAAVDAFLRKKSARRPSHITAQIVAKICQEKGNIQIQDLERFSGYTTRTLQRLFKTDVGLTPKGFSRAIRCQSAIYNINHQKDVAFSDLASELGFSDQSHFLREFKKLVNATPAQYQSRVQHTDYKQRIHCY